MRCAGSTGNTEDLEAMQKPQPATIKYSRHAAKKTKSTMFINRVNALSI